MREVIGQKLTYPETGPTFTASLGSADQAVWTARALWPSRVTADAEIALPPGYENVPGRVY